MTPAGTVIVDNTVSPGAHILRLTDRSMQSEAFNATEGGETRDYVSNTTETVLYTPSSGGSIWLVSINPKTLQRIANSPGGVCNGSFKWSTVQDNVGFCLLDNNQTATVNGQTVTGDSLTTYKLTFAYGIGLNCGFNNCVDVTQPPVWTLFASFANDCSEAQIAPTWRSAVSIASSDTVVSASYSTAGGQDTGHLSFLDNVSTKTCKTVDWAGNGVSPLIYPKLSGTPVVAMNGFTSQPLQCVFSTIHASSLTNLWLQAAYEAATGRDCSGFNAESPMLWDQSGVTIYPMSTIQYSAGHSAMDEENWYSNNLYAFPLSNLASGALIGNISTPGCSTCYDDHFSADWLHLGWPLIGTTGGRGGEVWALSPGGGPVMRFVKTYSSGDNGRNIPTGQPQNLFEAESSIGGSGQGRTIYCFTSDMLGQLGTFTDNQGNQWLQSDVFCVGLAGQ